MNNTARFAAQIDLLDSLPCQIRDEDLDLISGGFRSWDGSSLNNGLVLVTPPVTSAPTQTGSNKFNHQSWDGSSSSSI